MLAQQSKNQTERCDSDKPVPGMTLPARYFTCENLFAIERERLFHGSWFCVGREAELSTPGDYLLADVVGESVIVTRNEQGDVHAMRNSCRHRGTQVVLNASGNFPNCRIQCPYHRWTYDCAGQLIAAPHMNETPGFQREDWPLHAVPLATWEGFMFVNLSGTAEPLETVFGPFFERFRPWRVSELRSVHREEYEVATNWKMALENFCECYHCISVHPGLNELSPVSDTSNDFLEGPFLGGPMKLARESMTSSGDRSAPAIRTLGEIDRGRVYYYTLMPNMLFALHPDVVIAWRMTPHGPGKISIVTEWFFEPESIEMPDFDPSPSTQFWTICQQTYLGVSSGAYSPGLWSSQETIPQAFEREYLRQLGDA